MKDKIETEEGKPCDYRKKGHSEEGQENKNDSKQEIAHVLLSDANLKIFSNPFSPNLKEMRIKVMGKIISRLQTGRDRVTTFSPNSFSTETKCQAALNSKRHIENVARFIMASTRSFDLPESDRDNISIFIWRPSLVATQAAMKPTQRTRCLVSSSAHISPVEKKFLKITWAKAITTMVAREIMMKSPSTLDNAVSKPLMYFIYFTMPARNFARSLKIPANSHLGKYLSPSFS